eukprot:TRINITY_DN573_c0_g2_i1.p1 TRINITY_DN573_c0_g2~~TRINITY_DN573_c0_g2_i1.p1  ORF type:complete len:849 (+),score=216.24 TRINITY_DN573_c0_g2_i1:55-2601(+)
MEGRSKSPFVPMDAERETLLLLTELERILNGKETQLPVIVNVNKSIILSRLLHMFQVRVQSMPKETISDTAWVRMVDLLLDLKARVLRFSSLHSHCDDLLDYAKSLRLICDELGIPFDDIPTEELDLSVEKDKEEFSQLVRKTEADIVSSIRSIRERMLSLREYFVHVKLIPSEWEALEDADQLQDAQETRAADLAESVMQKLSMEERADDDDIRISHELFRLVSFANDIEKKVNDMIQREPERLLVSEYRELDQMKVSIGHMVQLLEHLEARRLDIDWRLELKPTRGWALRDYHERVERIVEHFLSASSSDSLSEERKGRGFRHKFFGKGLMLSGGKGVGKTAILSLLGSHKRIGEAFPDGIFYVNCFWDVATIESLKQDILLDSFDDHHRDDRFLEFWNACLVRKMFELLHRITWERRVCFQTLDEGRDWLMNALRGKKCLLLLDDAKHPSVIRCFDAFLRRENCGMILATSASVEEMKLAPNIFTEHVESLTVEEIMDHLSSALLSSTSSAAESSDPTKEKHEDDTSSSNIGEATPVVDRELAETILRSSNGSVIVLPSLVTIKENMDFPSWKEVVSTIEGKKNVIMMDEASPTRWMDAMFSMVEKVLSEQESDVLRSFAIFPTNEFPIPFKLIQILWDGKLSLEVLDKVMAKLEEIGIIQRVPMDMERLWLPLTWILYLRANLTPKIIQQLHSTFLKNAKKEACPNGFSKIPLAYVGIEEYIISHLTFHMYKAEEYSSITDLVFSYRWLHKRFTIGGAPGIVVDLRYALEQFRDTTMSVNLKSIVQVLEDICAVRFRKQRMSDPRAIEEYERQKRRLKQRRAKKGEDSTSSPDLTQVHQELLST